MIRGKVTRLHPLVEVQFVLPDHHLLGLEFVVDTGYTGDLTLPERAIASLALVPVCEIEATLADGTTVDVIGYGATVLWNGFERGVVVYAMEERPLLGTRLLANHRLQIDFTEHGDVQIEELT